MAQQATIQGLLRHVALLQAATLSVHVTGSAKYKQYHTQVLWCAKTKGQCKMSDLLVCTSCCSVKQLSHPSRGSEPDRRITPPHAGPL